MLQTKNDHKGEKAIQFNNSSMLIEKKENVTLSDFTPLFHNVAQIRTLASYVR